MVQELEAADPFSRQELRWLRRVSFHLRQILSLNKAQD